MYLLCYTVNMTLDAMSLENLSQSELLPVWQRSLAHDTQNALRADLQGGRIPYLVYVAEDLSNRLVREYADGRREYLDYKDSDIPVVTAAPSAQSVDA